MFRQQHTVCLTYRCKGLILLETYTSNRAEHFELPPFLDVQLEVTGDLDYSMYNLSKKHDPEVSVPSTLPEDSTNKSETCVEQHNASEPNTKVDDNVSTPSTSAPGPATDQPEMLVKPKTPPDPNTKVADSLPHGVKNGYCYNVALDQVASLSLSSLDISHDTAALNDSLSENGHVFFGDIADYERFAKWCHSGKTGAAVK